MKKVFLLGYTTLFTSLFPIIASAQMMGIKGLMLSVGRIVDILIPFMAALALLYFFWGLAQFILKSGDSDSHENGRQTMIWGIVALFVIVAVWGLVAFIQDAFLIPNVQVIPTPGF
jgi:hypothetical protein